MFGGVPPFPYCTAPRKSRLCAGRRNPHVRRARADRIAPSLYSRAVTEPTPPAEAVFAPWPRRAAAYLIDLFLVTSVAFVSLSVAAAFVTGADGAAVAALWPFVTLLVLLVYAPATMARPDRANGQTLGKQALGIRVVREDEAPVSFGLSAFREGILKWLLPVILTTVPALFLLAVVVNYAWPLFDAEHRALHDMVAKTHVVGREEPLDDAAPESP
jgi:uncharacterized RDD family membrane protein YckC